MINFFINLNPILQALIATLFTYAFTILGSALVFPFKNVNRSIMDAILGMAGGLMIAASFFSLIMPAIETSDALGQRTWFVISIGFLLGGILLFLTDKISSRLLDKYPDAKSKKRIFMLLFSITIHNIPEGMVVGLAFGSLASSNMSLASACLLALGIGIQNFPEGSALSIPLKREGMSTFNAFFLGQISGAVVEEIIPESQTNKRKDLMALFTIIGFLIMMVLDVGLG